MIWPKNEDTARTNTFDFLIRLKVHTLLVTGAQMVDE